MKNLKTALVIILIAFASMRSTAQFSKKWAEFTMKMKTTPWVLGIGWSVAQDDGGKWFKNLFNVDKAWNMAPYPARITCEKFLDEEKGWSIELMAAYNRYGVDNFLSDKSPERLVTAQSMLLSFDLCGKYNFNKLYDLNKLMFEGKETIVPYGVFGHGYTYRELAPHNHTATLNLGLGINIYVYKGWGIQLQSMAKFGMKAKFPTSGANYLQHSISIIYKLKPLQMHKSKSYKSKKNTIRKSL